MKQRKRQNETLWVPFPRLRQPSSLGLAEKPALAKVEAARNGIYDAIILLLRPYLSILRALWRKELHEAIAAFPTRLCHSPN